MFSLEQQRNTNEAFCLWSVAALAAGSLMSLQLIKTNVVSEETTVVKKTEQTMSRGVGGGTSSSVRQTAHRLRDSLTD